LTEREPYGLQAVLTREPGRVLELGTWETDNASSHRGGEA
jgi:hypothetical protein